MTKAVWVREEGGQTVVTPGGLKMVTQWAAEHKSQRWIASQLGVTAKKFEKMLDRAKGDNDLRMAWESGYALFEQGIIDKFRGIAFGDIVECEALDLDGKPLLNEDGKPQMVKVEVPQSKAATIAAIYFTKAQLGWTEKPTGILVQDNRIQITIPASMERGELLKALDQDKPADFTKKRIELKEINPAAPKGILDGQALLSPPKPKEDSNG